MGKNETHQVQYPRLVFRFSGYSLHSTKRADGIVAIAEAYLRLIRRDDNFPPRGMRITIQAGPELDEGEVQILAADVEEQLVDVLKILGVTLEDASSGPSGTSLVRGEDSQRG